MLRNRVSQVEYELQALDQTQETGAGRAVAVMARVNRTSKRFNKSGDRLARQRGQAANKAWGHGARAPMVDCAGCGCPVNKHSLKMLNGRAGGPCCQGDQTNA